MDNYTKMTHKKQVQAFKNTVWEYYKKNKRDFPWRSEPTPYNVFISEVMLQQTQTYRVLPKYEAWIARFPDFKTLANSPFSEVLQYWSGLGYNRRALYLHKASQIVINEYNGLIPKDPELLVKLPGIGKATAASIIVFSYNIPLVFIETNIRRVFIHEFFGDKENIDDKDIYKLVKESVDQKNPREWYYALMDYGSYLPKQTTNPNRKSKHYTKQSKFEGSLRQVRGRILQILTAQNPIDTYQLEKLVNVEPERFEKALSQLTSEGFLEINHNKVKIK